MRLLTLVRKTEDVNNVVRKKRTSLFPPPRLGPPLSVGFGSGWWHFQSHKEHNVPGHAEEYFLPTQGRKDETWQCSVTRYKFK